MQASPYINHFLQPDTAIPDLSNPQSLNRFAYANNSPVNFSDPSGHDAYSTCGGNSSCMNYVTEKPELIDTNASKVNELKPKKKDPKELKLSDTGLNFILNWEHFEPKLYNDGNLEADKYYYNIQGKGTGNCTIGYGLLIHTGPCDGRADEKRYKNGIDKPTALALIDPFLEASEKIVRDNVNVKLTQSQFDALVSYVFNVGDLGDNIPSLLNEGKYYDATLAVANGPNTIKGSGYSPGLAKRREQEALMFIYGP